MSEWLDHCCYNSLIAAASSIRQLNKLDRYMIDSEENTMAFMGAPSLLELIIIAILLAGPVCGCIVLWWLVSRANSD